MDFTVLRDFDVPTDDGQRRYEVGEQLSDDNDEQVHAWIRAGLVREGHGGAVGAMTTGGPGVSGSAAKPAIKDSVAGTPAAKRDSVTGDKVKDE